MMVTRNSYKRGLVALLVTAAGIPGVVLAGTPVGPPSVTYSPFASSIPTLGTAMLLLLALFLAMLAVRMLRDGPSNGNRVAGVALAVGLLALVAGGVGVVNGVRAVNGGGPVIANTLFDEQGGGTVTLEPPQSNFRAQVANDTAVQQQITAINAGSCSLSPLLDAGLFFGPPLPDGAQNVGDCEVGLVLPPADYCSIEFFACPVVGANGGENGGGVPF
ncbi:MAG: midcut-by-XrtH protein [Chromatocurvus sp.]